MPATAPTRFWTRALLGLLIGASLPAKADPGGAAPVPRRPVAVAMFLWRGPTESERAFMAALEAAPGLAPNFTVLDAQADPARLAGQIRAARSGHFDLCYAFGTTVAAALKAAFRDTPIVFDIVSRPVESGIIADWGHSGNNLTGISNVVPMASAFQTLRLMVHFRKLAFLYNPQEANSRIQLAEVVAQQERFGFRVRPVPLGGAGTLAADLKGLMTSGVDAVLLPSDSAVLLHAGTILAFLNSFGIPTIATIPDLVETDGAFISLGPDYAELGRLAAQNALAVLSGRAPGDVPSRTGTALKLVVNMKTAKRLGVSLPIQLLKISELVQ